MQVVGWATAVPVAFLVILCDLPLRWTPPHQMTARYRLCDPDGMTGEPITIAILIVAALGVWLWLRRDGGASRGAETRLRSICLGDDRQVERLISGETARAPGISRAEAASRAVDRYRRDNR